MVAAGYIVEFLFGGLGLIPTTRNAKVVEESITWNYTNILNIVFLALAAGLLCRFVTTGGIPMLRMMGGSPDQNHDHHHEQSIDARHDTMHSPMTPGGGIPNERP